MLPLINKESMLILGLLHVHVHAHPYDHAYDRGHVFQLKFAKIINNKYVTFAESPT